jgi:hypothetical protein
MRRIILSFISSVILSIIGFMALAGIYKTLELLKVDVNFGGDKGNVFFCLFLGLPLGGISGILLIEKLVYKSEGWNILGIGASVLLSLISIYLGIILMDRAGGEFVLLIPIVVGLFCLFGYKIGFLFK